ncbi:hypothetical protein GCM10009552_30810 [Rothia nasimurium]
MAETVAREARSYMGPVALATDGRAQARSYMGMMALATDGRAQARSYMGMMALATDGRAQARSYTSRLVGARLARDRTEAAFARESDTAVKPQPRKAPCARPVLAATQKNNRPSFTSP